MPVSRAEPFRTRLLRAALEALASQADVLGGRVEIHIHADGVVLSYVALAAELQVLAGDPRRAGLSPMELAILDALTPEPQPVKLLARRAGYSLASHFYAALRKLANLGLCRRHPGNQGYSLPT